jgi:HPt (histidine-containing phosphotransfer) domain-containing protein
MDRLNELTDGKPRELVDLYLVQAEELLQGIDEALAAKASVRLAELAHKLCGSSATCGMTGIVPTLHQLEDLASANQLAECAAPSAEARRQFTLLREYFDSRPR